MDSARELLGGGGSDLLPGKKAECCPSLSLKQRIIGFAVCAALGALCGTLGSISIFLAHSIVGFAVLYTFSNIFGVASSFFLSGPKKQLKRIFHPVRAGCAIAFFVFMGLTLFAALGLNNGGLVILFVILQFLALTWYTLSFVPGAQKLAKKCMGRAIESV